MKRMKPDAYKLEAASTADNLFRLWTAKYGEWNRDKILDELERILRRKRRG